MPVDENVMVETVEDESTVLPEAEETENAPLPSEEPAKEDVGNEEVEPSKSTPRKKPRYRDLQAEIRQMQGRFDEQEDALKALYAEKHPSTEQKSSSDDVINPQPQIADNRAMDSRTERKYSRQLDKFANELADLHESDDSQDVEVAQKIQGILDGRGSYINKLSTQTQQTLLLDGISPDEVIKIEQKMRDARFRASTPDIEYREMRQIVEDIRRPAPKKVKAPMKPLGKVSGQPKTAPAKRDVNYYRDRFLGKR